LSEDIPTIRKYIGQVKEFTIPFIQAASEGKLKSLKEFQNVKLNKSVLCKAISNVSECGYLECLKFLLAWYKESKEYRKIDEIEDHADAFVSAAIGAQFHIIKYIVQFKLIDQHAINEAFIEVASCESPSVKMLELLFKMGLTGDTVTKAITKAESCGCETETCLEHKNIIRHILKMK
jgi:hypothetical protein